MYIDKSNDNIQLDNPNERLNDVYQLAVTMIETIRKVRIDDIENIVCDLMCSEPFCNYEELKDKLLNDFKNDH